MHCKQLDIPSEDVVVHIETDCSAVYGDENFETGTLYITEDNVVWRKADGNGFSLQYRLIGLHGVSKDLSNYPKEHLFLIVQDVESTASSEESEEGDDSEDNEKTAQIRFIPEKVESLSAMYKAMTDCQLMHPDTDAEQDDYDDEEYEEEENGETANGMDIQEGQFDDA